HSQQRHQLPASGRLEIGRTADLILSDPMTSRRHALLEWNCDGAWVTDLGSKHGTFVNDEQLVPKLRTRISAPCWITIASSEIYFGRLGRTGSAGSFPPVSNPEHAVPRESPAMQRLYRDLDAAARSDFPITLLGETGVGKTRLARYIHD